MMPTEDVLNPGGQMRTSEVSFQNIVNAEGWRRIHDSLEPKLPSLISGGSLYPGMEGSDGKTNRNMTWRR